MGNDEQWKLRQERHMQRLVDDFESLKMLVEKNNTSLEEFIELAKVFKFGMKIIGFIEKVAVFITKLALAGGAVWAGWKFIVTQAIAAALRKL